jgi:hypothetical protein
MKRLGVESSAEGQHLGFLDKDASAFMESPGSVVLEVSIVNRCTKHDLVHDVRYVFPTSLALRLHNMRVLSSSSTSGSEW